MCILKPCGEPPCFGFLFEYVPERVSLKIISSRKSDSLFGGKVHKLHVTKWPVFDEWPTEIEDVISNFGLGCQSGIRGIKRDTI
jgi:hypothetical protein